MHRFDMLHVVSDLHLGGIKTKNKNFQIFNQGERLANFINRIAKEKPEQAVGLVLNGDIVDFLAEDQPRYLDTQHATAKLERIYHDASFIMVFKALEDFVLSPNRTLVIVLGNHDVELALPAVKSWLVKQLSHNDDAAKGRIIYATDGAGFPCMVGNKSVLCVHGNEADEWNVVDYFQLHKVSRELNRGNNPTSWDANAGTRMVIDVMNEVKKTYPMVDLLKPERLAAIPTILALDPSKAKKLPKIIGLKAASVWDKIKMAIGFLSAEDEHQQLAETTAVEQQKLNQLLGDTFTLNPSTSVADMLMQANRRIEQGKPANDPDVAQEGLLGIGDYLLYVVDRLLDKDKSISLRESLGQLLKGDSSFALNGEDEGFEQLDKMVSGDIDYLIAGHTHLARAMGRNNGSGVYYNSGTWIRLIELDDHTLENGGEFARVFTAFADGSLDALDELIDLGQNKDKPLVKRDTCYAVSVIAADGHTQAQLSEVAANGQYRAFPDSEY